MFVYFIERCIRFYRSFQRIEVKKVTVSYHILRVTYKLREVLQTVCFKFDSFSREMDDKWQGISSYS